MCLVIIKVYIFLFISIVFFKLQNIYECRIQMINFREQCLVLHYNYYVYYCSPFYSPLPLPHLFEVSHVCPKDPLDTILHNIHTHTHTDQQFSYHTQTHSTTTFSVFLFPSYHHHSYDSFSNDHLNNK